MNGLPAILSDAFQTLRQRATLADAHRRLPEAVAHFYLGADMALQCAVELGAIEHTEADDLGARVWEALVRVGAAQGVLIAIGCAFILTRPDGASGK